MCRAGGRNPADAGDFRVFNQFTEQFSVGQLAELVKAAAAELDIEVEIEHLPNPRVEAEEHYYNAKHTKLLDLGLGAGLLGDELVRSMLKAIEAAHGTASTATIEPHTTWKSGRESQAGVSPAAANPPDQPLPTQRASSLPSPHARR